MELRHLRCFIAVAEELHFARAAERLHIEQSPLSRAIKELEEELGVSLFARTTRSTRLTRAGNLFLEHVPRVFAALEQARDSVRAAASGFHGQLRIALSDGITPSRLPALLAQCRLDEPEVDIRLFEVPLSQQIKGLIDDLYDVGFAQSDEVVDFNNPAAVATVAKKFRALLEESGVKVTETEAAQILREVYTNRDKLETSLRNVSQALYKFKRVFDE